MPVPRASRCIEVVLLLALTQVEGRSHVMMHCVLHHGLLVEDHLLGPLTDQGTQIYERRIRGLLLRHHHKGTIVLFHFHLLLGLLLMEHASDSTTC